MIVAIIIARKGSTRLPGKNARLLCGKPLTEWSIIQAKCSRLIDHVILATDHEGLAGIALKHGCSVHWRENVKDDDPGNIPFLNAMNWYEGDTGEKPEAYVTMLPTAPLRLPGQLDEGIVRFRRGDADIVEWIWVQKEFYPHHLVYKGDTPMWAFPCRFDKGWNYGTPFGGDTVMHSDTYRKVTEYTIDHEGVVCAWRGFYGIVPVQQWQLGETDTEESFADVELFMKNRILFPLGEDCYERYREGR